MSETKRLYHALDGAYHWLMNLVQSDIHVPVMEGRPERACLGEMYAALCAAEKALKGENDEDN